MTSPLPRSGPPRPGRYTKYPAKPVYRVLRPEAAPLNTDDIASQFLCLAVAALPRQNCNYGVHAYQRVLMLRPLNTALDFECRPLQLLCFGVAALLGNSPTQTTHSSQGVRILRPEDASLKIECLAV